MIKWFVAYYAPERPYSYHASDNKFYPYGPWYRKYFNTYDEAIAAARHARRHNKDKRKYIFIDCAYYQIAE